MSIFGKYKDTFKRVALSCDKFASAYTFALIFFFVPYCIATVGGYVMWILPVACLIPFAVMPLLYTLIHRFSPLLFGRYHLFLPISGVLSAVFSVLMWSAVDGSAASVCALFFGAVLFASFNVVYRYCAFSVRIRLIGDDVALPPLTSRLIAFIGAASAFGAACGFYYSDSSAMFMNTAYTVGAVSIIGVAIHYLASYTEIPKLGSKRYITVGDAFRDLYSGINARLFISPTLLLAAFAVVAALVAYLSFFTVGAECAFAATGALLGAFAVGTVVFAKLISSHNVTGVTALALVILSTVFMFTAVGVDGIRYGCLVAGSVFAGLSGACAMRLARLCAVSLKRGMTGGTVFILLGFVILAAGAFVCNACAAAAFVTAAVGLDGFYVGIGIADIAAIAAAAVYCSGLKRKPEADAADRIEAQD